MFCRSLTTEIASIGGQSARSAEDVAATVAHLQKTLGKNPQDFYRALSVEFKIPPEKLAHCVKATNISTTTADLSLGVADFTS